MPNSLQIAVVSVHVRPDRVDAFREATMANARESCREPGVARFDVVQDREDPTRFLMIEVFRHADAPAAHRETAHYKLWRDTVADMMAEPRSAKKYVNVSPDDDAW